MPNETPCLPVVEAAAAAAVATHTTAYFAIVTFVTEAGPTTFAETVHLDTKLKATDRVRAVYKTIPGFPGMQAVAFCSVEPNLLSRAGEAFEAFVSANYVTEDDGSQFHSSRSTNSKSAPDETIQGRTSRRDAPGEVTRELLYRDFASRVSHQIKAISGFTIAFSKL